MAKLILEIPAEILDAFRFPAAELENELRKELAVALYHRGILPLGKARLLAEMDRWQFEQLLGDRQVTRHYTETDLEEDLEYARDH